MADHSSNKPSSSSETTSHHPSSSSRLKGFKKIFKSSSSSSSVSSRVKGFFTSIPTKLKKLFKTKPSPSSHANQRITDPNSMKPMTEEEISEEAQRLRKGKKHMTEEEISEETQQVEKEKKPMNVKPSTEEEIPKAVLHAQRKLVLKALLDRPDQIISSQNPPKLTFQRNASNLSNSSNE